MRDAALRMAEKGIPVFPCGKNKAPLVATGLYAATCSATQIEAWWRQWPDACYGIPTGSETGFFLLDVDVKPGIDGNDALHELEIRHGKLPDTFEVLTPSGGRHLYFRQPEGVRVKNSTGALGPGLDVRGDGGYGIGPGSKPNGRAYEVEASSTQKMADAPDWLLSMVRAEERQQPSETTPHRMIGEGERDDTLFRIASALRSKGLSVEAAEAALQIENTQRCHPPLDPSQVSKIARSIGRYERPEVSPAPSATGRSFPFLLPADLATITPTKYLVSGWLETRTVNLLYAPKDTMKSFLGVDWGLCVASGIDWHGAKTKRATLIYIAGEGNRGYSRRLRAWCIRHRVDMMTLPIAVSDRPLQVLDSDVMAEWSLMIAELKARFGHEELFVVIDTLATNFGPGDENKPTDMARFIAQLRIYLVAQLGATVLVVHHSGKNVQLGARGGSSIEGNADNVYVLSRKAMGEDEEDLIELKCKHTKDAARSPMMTFKPQVVELGVADEEGHQLTSLVLEVELTPRQRTILAELELGRTHRGIATMLDVSKQIVTREIMKLKAMGLVK